MVDLPERSRVITPVVKVYPTQDAAWHLGKYPLHVDEGGLYITVEGKDIQVVPIGAGMRKGSYQLNCPEDVNEFKQRT